MRSTTALVMIVLILVSAFLIMDWDEYVTDEAGSLPATIATDADELDTKEEVGIDYTITGSITTTTFNDDAIYRVVVWHGTTTETARVVLADDYIVTTPPRIVVLDWDVVDGGTYQPGNGALGFEITNNNNGKTHFVWTWEE